MRSLRFTLVSLLLLLASAAISNAAETRGYVFTTDYMTGSLSLVNLADRAVSQDVATGICSDARLRWQDGQLYVVNRLGCDNLLVLDGTTLAFVRQFSVGNGTNPSDIVLVTPTKAYVPRYDAKSLLIVDPTNGAVAGQIPLEAFADADSIPEMDRAIRIGDKVFVSLQRLDRTNFFAPTDHSDVVVIDAVADTVIDTDGITPGVQPIRLTGTNPVTAFAYDPVSHRLLIGCAGAYGVLDGGIEWVNPATLASEGYAITGAALGGDLSDVVWRSSSHSYAIVSDASFNTILKSWNPVTGTVIAPMFAPGGFSLADCEMNDRDELYVCDNSFTAPGLFVFSTVNDAMIAGPLDTGLPPNQITFDRSENVAGVVPRHSALRLDAPVPNPARSMASIAFELDRPGNLKIEVFDVAGRSVRILGGETWPAGRNAMSWDLRDRSGIRVRPGIYLARATLDRVLVRNPDTGLEALRIAVLD